MKVPPHGMQRQSYRIGMLICRRLITTYHKFSAVARETSKPTYPVSRDGIKLSNVDWQRGLRNWLCKIEHFGFSKYIHRMTPKHPYQLLPIDERVKRVLATTPLIDGHNDLPQQPRACFHGKIHNNEKFDLENGFERGMTDIPRLKQGSSISASILNWMLTFF